MPPQLDRLFYGGGEYVSADEAVRQVMALQRENALLRTALGGAIDDLSIILPSHDDALVSYRAALASDEGVR